MAGAPPCCFRCACWAGPPPRGEDASERMDILPGECMVSYVQCGLCCRRSARIEAVFHLAQLLCNGGRHQTLAESLQKKSKKQTISTITGSLADRLARR